MEMTDMREARRGYEANPQRHRGIEIDAFANRQPAAL